MGSSVEKLTGRAFEGGNNEKGKLVYHGFQLPKEGDLIKQVWDYKDYNIKRWNKFFEKPV